MVDTGYQADDTLPVTPAALRAAITKHGLTQQQAAQYLGVTKGAVSRWLSGQRPIPSMAMLALKGYSRRTVQAARKLVARRSRNGNNLKG